MHNILERVSKLAEHRNKFILFIYANLNLFKFIYANLYYFTQGTDLYVKEDNIASYLYSVLIFFVMMISQYSNAHYFCPQLSNKTKRILLTVNYLAFGSHSNDHTLSCT